MTAVSISLALLAMGLFLWSYLFYPILVRWLARRALAPGSSFGGGSFSAEVIISAADEEGVIGDRVRDLLAQETDRPLRVTVGCDGCTDKTGEEARAAGGAGVEVVEFPARRGKAGVINSLVLASGADVIVFTDANTRFDPGAVRRLLAPFGDPRVGAVCGRLLIEAEGEAKSSPEVLFWDRETRLKETEGRLGVCLGANGAIYAARRAQIERLPEDSSLDDFLIPARVARRGSAVVFAGDAVAREQGGLQGHAEVSRRFRIGVGAGQVLRRETWLFAFGRHPLLSLAFLSRKAARWIAPVLLLLALAAGLASNSLSSAAAGLSAGLLALFLLVWVRPVPRGLFGKLCYFCAMNLALAFGVVSGLAGASRPVWKRAPR